ncbi:MAG TPA: discoidin domain-containing protein [Anaerolineales bacterium]
MKASSSPHDQEVIEILERLKSLTAEYPAGLLSARRAAFINQVMERREASDGEVQPSPEQAEQEIVAILQGLRHANAEYPTELLATRRAAFMNQIAQRRQAVNDVRTSEDQEILQALDNLRPVKTEYPQELLAARRAAFLDQAAQLGKVNVEEAAAAQDQEIIQLLRSLKSASVEYPAKLLNARRATFVGQIRRWGGISLLDVLRSAIQSKLSYIDRLSLAPMMKVMRTSLVVASVLAIAFVASWLGNRTTMNEAFNPSPTQVEVSRPIASSTTSTQESQTTICKPGYLPPLCLAKKFDTNQDLTFQGNGARPAVAKDTLPGHSGIHQPAYANDGQYGNGSSWVSNSAYSWIKIDLGQATAINTVTFGRDRLGNYSDRHPGQFTIAVALSDNVYADGNSSDDMIEYKTVYDSERSGFSGTVSGSETVQAHFGSVVARYVKITFSNPGTAIDEVEAFMVQPAVVQSGRPTDRPNNRPPRATQTPIPTHTLRPTNTSTPIPTNTLTHTPWPTNTPTDTPTNTPRPTNTPTDIPTNTPRPTNMPTDIPTSTPRPTNMPTDIPTNTLTDIAAEH